MIVVVVVDVVVLLLLAVAAVVARRSPCGYCYVTSYFDFFFLLVLIPFTLYLFLLLNLVRFVCFQFIFSLCGCCCCWCCCYYWCCSLLTFCVVYHRLNGARSVSQRVTDSLWEVISDVRDIRTTNVCYIRIFWWYQIIYVHTYGVAREQNECISDDEVCAMGERERGEKGNMNAAAYQCVVAIYHVNVKT